MPTSASNKGKPMQNNIDGIVVNGTLHCLVEYHGGGCACSDCSLNKECFDERSTGYMCNVIPKNGEYQFRDVGVLMPVRKMDISRARMQ